VKSSFFITFLGAFTVPHREGQTEEDFLPEIFELTPATAALKKWSDDHFYESAILLG
jgi:hypothetical protein